MTIGVFGVLITNLQLKGWHASNPAFKRLSMTMISEFISPITFLMLSHIRT